MRFAERVGLVVLLAVFPALGAYAGDEKPSRTDDGAAAAKAASPSADSAADRAARTEDASSETAAPAATKASANATDTPAPIEVSTPAPAALAPKPADQETAAAEGPRFLPMMAWDGNPGLFTLETGEILPSGAFNFTAGSNKISRMPGAVTILQTGPAGAVGINRWLSIFVQVNANEHVHVDVPSNLSLNPAGNTGLQYQNTIYSSIIPATGFPPAYVEDYPFISSNGGGVGEVDLGFKLGLLSERRGNRLSLSIRNDFYIPTKTGFNDLLDDEVQSGKFNYGVGVEASKNIKGAVVATLNWGYRFTRQSTFNAPIPGFTQPEVLKQADQMTAGFGLLMFPNKRINVITEYNGLVYVRKGIQNTSFGARDPAESITGLRLYLTRGLAIDVGYRYSLSLSQDVDRNGFIAKVDIAHWPHRPHVAASYDTLTVSCSAEVASVAPGGVAQITANATDSLNYPITYVWSASAGRIDGVGPFVRWDSTGLAPGNYTVNVRVDDGAGKSATCSQPVGVH